MCMLYYIFGSFDHAVSNKNILSRSIVFHFSPFLITFHYTNYIENNISTCAK